MKLQTIAITLSAAVCMAETVDWHWNEAIALLGSSREQQSQSQSQSRQDVYTDDQFDLPDAKLGAPLLRSSGRDEDDYDFSGAKQAGAAETIREQYSDASKRSCRIEPPYLYVTTHDYSNVLKYTMDGCLVDHAVLTNIPVKRRTELRSMVLQGEHLIVANAAASEAQLMAFGKCSPDNGGRREWKATVVADDKDNRGASHAYGVTVDSDYNVYASFQHTDVVLRFFASGAMEAMPLPPVLIDSTQRHEFWPGTFHQFGTREQHGEGVRGMAMVGRDLWVANEDIDGVVVIDTRSGLVTDIIPVDAPVGVHFSPAHNLVFIGSKVKHWDGSVAAFDRRTMRRVQTFKTTKMTHPTGLAVWGDVLYIGEQDLNRIYAFDITTGMEMGKVIDKLPGQIEQILLVDC